MFKLLAKIYFPPLSLCRKSQQLLSNINSPTVLFAGVDVCKTTAGKFIGRRLLLISFFSVFILNQAHAFDKSTIEPSLKAGATTFNQRCILCHGSVGMGEGLLPMAIEDYPKTNLLDPKIAIGDENLRKYIIWGGLGGNKSPYSPPWGSKLTATQLESVIVYIKSLRTTAD